MRVGSIPRSSDTRVDRDEARAQHVADAIPSLPQTRGVPQNPAPSLSEPGASGVKRGRTPLVIAHRGGAAEAPENTLAAFRNALRAHADWSELDIVLSRDGHLMVIHDDTVDRTTNGHGRVEDMTFEQLRRLDAGRGEHVPTLEETLALPGSRLVIELKRTSRPDALAESTVAAIRLARAHGRVIIASFETDLLRRVHAIDPSIPLLGFVGDERALAPMLELPLEVLGVSSNVVEAALASGGGHAVWAWTIQDPPQARQLVQHGVDGIITDKPSAMIPALK
jgi:glycerophosphoryl diester phosphodiesterase